MAEAPAGGNYGSHRLENIDFIRGLVMIVMALDHVRDFFSNAQFLPTDLAATTAPYFLTRWITHFCAPVFALLTGTGAFLWCRRDRTQSDLRRFLVQRGAWLILVELTIVRCFGWTFNFDYRVTLAGVLWILGWSMIVLAFAISLPIRVFTVIALATIAGHNALDRVPPSAFGRFAVLWAFLHNQANLSVAGHNFYTANVLIPWFAVMMAGFSLGPVFRWEQPVRRRYLLRLGSFTTALFIVVRAINAYGDPFPWAPQKNPLFTLFSFLNCTKYPPSLDFLLMTLGPALILLGLLDGYDFGRLRPAMVFGRVPLFYYVAHLALVHLIAVGVCYWQFGSAHWLFISRTIADFPTMFPSGWGVSLPMVYLIWAVLVVALYPLCKWFAGLKQRGGSAWNLFQTTK